MMREVLAAVLFLLLSSKIDCFSCSNSSCPTNCNCCSTGDTCISCLTHYRINYYITIDTNTIPDPINASNTITTFTSRTAANCLPCTDPNCLFCNIDGGGFEHCTECSQYYGVNFYNDIECSYCDQYNARNCRWSNNCQNAHNCSNCNSYDYDWSLHICFACWDLFRYCYSCSSSMCYSCKSGYYLNYTNYQECVDCILPNCISCSHGPQCISCISGFYVKNGACLPCLYPCLTCNINDCFTCNTTGNLYVLSNKACVTCDSIITNCNTCLKNTSGSFTCIQCSTNYFDTGSACSSCASPCLTCINSSSTCLSCTDTLRFLTSSNTCDLCNTVIPECQTCLSQNICLTCSYGFVVAFLASSCTACDQFLANCENCTTSACLICKPGSSMVGTICQINSNCDPNCLSCETGLPATCASCFTGFYLEFSNKTCMICPNSCATCSSSKLCPACSTMVYCLTCPDGAYLSGSACFPCPVGTYYHRTTYSCLPCPTYCTACTVTGCTACESALFALSPLGRCEEVCGDGYVVTLPCDGGFKLNDGCTNDCSIENNYNCTYNSIANPYWPSIAAVRTSQCSFIGITTAALNRVSQSLFSNRVQVVFQVQPYLYGLPFGNEDQSYLRSIFQLAPLDQLTDYTISVDPSLQTVAFDITYAVDISSSSLNLNINYAALSALPMFYYTSNQSFAFKTNSITAASRLGAFHSDDEYTSNKAIYVAAVFVAALGYLPLVLGLFARELAGLQHMLICQTVFFLLLFRQQGSNFYLQGLIGLKYSSGIDIFGSSAGRLSPGQPYLYGINTESFLNNFNLNFLLILVPMLISPFFMLYRIKNKHLPVKKDLGKSAAELLIGEMPLYFAVFNFYGLVSFAYLYYHSLQQQQIFNSVLILSSAALTLFAWSHLIFRPEAVGCFRSAFSSYKTYIHNDAPRGQLARRIQECISWRPNAQEWKEQYRVLCINFYFLLLAYQIAAVFAIIYSFHLILSILQAVVLLFLFLFKPYLKSIEKFRSMLAFLIMLLSNLVNFIPINSTAVPGVILSLLFIHLLITGYVVIKGSYLQFVKKCTERSQVVRKLFNEEKEKELTREKQIEQQRLVVNDLIQKYHELDISDKFKEFREAPPKLQEPRKDEEISNHEYMITEERILDEENKHLRYMEGMNFLKKYGMEVDEDIVKRHYANI